MKLRHSFILPGALALAACVFEPPPKPAPTPKPAAEKPRPSRFDCSFTDPTGVRYRSYLMNAGALVEAEKPHGRFKVTVDDGETITARREARGGAVSLLTIDLRRHEAVLTEISAVTGGSQTLPGTCAEH